MKVKELIKELQKFKPNQRVMLSHGRTLDYLINASKNGDVVQLNCECMFSKKEILKTLSCNGYNIKDLKNMHIDVLRFHLNSLMEGVK